jgi:hypothetical protein
MELLLFAEQLFWALARKNIVLNVLKKSCIVKMFQMPRKKSD